MSTHWGRFASPSHLFSFFGSKMSIITTPRVAIAMESINLKMQQRIQILKQVVFSQEFKDRLSLSAKGAKVFAHADGTLSVSLRDSGSSKTPPSESEGFYIFVFPVGAEISAAMFEKMFTTRDYIFMYYSQQPAEGISALYGVLYKAARTSGIVLEPKKTEFVTFDL